MQNKTLFDQLEAFTFPASFLPRLCRENSWSSAHGQNVLAEYRRFLYLAAVSPHPVTP